LRVRYRIDGMMLEAKTFSKDQESSIIARIKIMAKIDITETRLPQDGHLRFHYGGHAVDVRVSTLPTVHGEKVVLRLLDSSKGIKKLEALGLGEKVLASFESAIHCPNGMVLVTGPTGSGKTTTLYAAIASLNKPELNIVTLEDPVEYRLEHINQVEIFSRIGLTFAAGLRSVLRQDPNIILVGEIRDLETAEIAVQAAITGHLVFSTLHTNDAASSIHRLMNMKAEPFLLAAALRGIMAQRLLRKLCAKCRRPHKLTAPERESLGAMAKGVEETMEAVGCSDCFRPPRDP
jgi:type IV pilus assembly protein PilB